MAVVDIGDAERVLTNVGKRGFDALVLGVQQGVLQGQGIVQGRASGRPGPRVRTGNYRRSIAGDTSAEYPLVLGQIGTNMPQGPRLENGFTGQDILGRNYDQPPFPHFAPSVPEIMEVTQARIVDNIGKI